jgi:3-oxoacyl-[acyl-carrier protein] reductase
VYGDPADFGRVVAFLCSEPANFVSGTALQVDGAATLGLL